MHHFPINSTVDYRVPLSLEVPLTLNGGEPPAKPNLHRVGHFLWYVLRYLLN